MASTYTLVQPSAVAIPIRENNPSGSQMATRHASSSRQSRWQPYILGTHSIPNKKALPCLVRPRLSTYSASSNSDLLALPTHAPVPDARSPCVRPAQLDEGRAMPVTTKQHDPASQLPTPSHSPAGMPPALLQQTSSNYVLELSLAILSSVYLQPGYRAAPNFVHLQSHDPLANHAESLALKTPSTLLPMCPSKPAASEPPTSPSHRAPKHQIAPLTPQSPRSSKHSPPAPAPTCLPHQQPMELQSLPSRSALARHLSALGAIGAQSDSSTSQAVPGSMRWFLTELFKRAALPGLIIRVAAGYVLRCRTAIAHALHTVALKSKAVLHPGPQPQSPPGSAPPPVERTPRERVLTDARRVFLASLVLACKFVFDKPYDNRSWSLISGLGSRDIGECERVIGDVLQWRLWIGAGRAPAPQ